MSKEEKLRKRLFKNPKDSTYKELKSLLAYYNYDEHKAGHTSGSRIAVINQATKHIIRLHKPHPGNMMKSYQVKEIIEILKDQEMI
jgi:hypothetical protein